MVGFETTRLPGVNTKSQLLKHSSLASSQSTHAAHSTAGAGNSSGHRDLEEESGMTGERSSQESNNKKATNFKHEDANQH